MEYLSRESVRKSIKMFMHLIEKSSIKKSESQELFAAYDDPEISYIMEMFEEEAEIILLRTNDSIYYTPHAENKFLGFTNDELRKSIGITNNTELYLCHIIVLCILIKFYNGENYNMKCRTILKVEELERFITSKLNATAYRIDGKQEDEKIGVNFIEVSKLWIDIPSYDEKIVNYSRSTGTRISYIYKTLYFMRDQGLINLDKDNEIFTTQKLDVMATAYYPESSRKKELLDYIESLVLEEDKNAKD